MEISHLFNNDIEVDETGDLACVDNDVLTQQKIVRRLLTNPKSYIWHTEYGGGIGKYIGELLTNSKFNEIKASITSQIFYESSVAKNPAPVIDLSQKTIEQLDCDIYYYDSITKQPFSLEFQVGK